MTYGLKTFDSHGKTMLNSDHFVPRLRWTKVISASNSSSTTVDGISGRKPFPCCIPLDDGLSHDVTISGDTVTWTAKSWADENSVDSLLSVFLLS
jgi:hypothetical protein